MNKIYIFFGLFLLVSCGPSDIPSNGLEERLGVYYEVNSQIPYSGPIERYHVNGQLRFKANYKDGKKEDGLWEFYHDNGKLKDSGNYKDGKKEGFWEFYYQNGQLQYKENYKDGKLDGPFEKYYQNGQLEYKKTYKDGKQHGLVESYDENGLCSTTRSKGSYYVEEVCSSN